MAIPKFEIPLPWESATVRSATAPQNGQTESNLMRTAAVRPDANVNSDLGATRAFRRESIDRADSVSKFELGITALVEMSADQTGHGWDYLRRGSLFNARKSFVTAILDVGSRIPPTGNVTPSSPASAPSFSINDILLGHEGLLNEFVRGAASPHAVAIRITQYVANAPELAQALYGLGKTYDAISQEPMPIMPGSEYLAATLYLAAHMASPEHLQSINDFAVLLHRIGKKELACNALVNAARSRVNPRLACNLAKVFLELDRPADALDCYEWVLSIDRKNKDALRGYLQIRMSSLGSALYPDDCRQLAHHLYHFVRESGADSSDGQWGIIAFEHLRILGREVDLNAPSMMGRLWHDAILSTEKWERISGLATAPPAGRNDNERSSSLPNRVSTMKPPAPVESVLPHQPNDDALRHTDPLPVGIPRAERREKARIIFVKSTDGKLELNDADSKTGTQGVKGSTSAMQSTSSG